MKEFNPEDLERPAPASRLQPPAARPAKPALAPAPGTPIESVPRNYPMPAAVTPATCSHAFLYLEFRGAPYYDQAAGCELEVFKYACGACNRPGFEFRQKVLK